MNIKKQPFPIGCILHQLSPVAGLEKMSDPAVQTIVADGVCGLEPSHESGKIAPRRFQNKMKND